MTTSKVQSVRKPFDSETTAYRYILVCVTSYRDIKPLQGGVIGGITGQRRLAIVIAVITVGGQHINYSRFDVRKTTMFVAHSL